MKQFTKYMRDQGYDGPMAKAIDVLDQIKGGEWLVGESADLASDFEIYAYVQRTGDGPEGLKDLMSF